MPYKVFIYYHISNRSPSAVSKSESAYSVLFPVVQEMMPSSSWTETGLILDASSRKMVNKFNCSSIRWWM